MSADTALISTTLAENAQPEVSGKRRRRRPHKNKGKKARSACSEDAQVVGSEQSPAPLPGPGKKKKGEKKGECSLKRSGEMERTVNQDQTDAPDSHQLTGTGRAPELKRSIRLVHCSKAPRFTSWVNISAMGEELFVTVTNEATVVDDWIKATVGSKLCSGAQCGHDQCPQSSGCREAEMRVGASSSLEREDGAGEKSCMLGMDVEWRPSFAKGVSNPPALLQLSTADQCLLIQLLFLDCTPQGLQELLASPDVCLGGVGVKQDALKLDEHHGLGCRSESLLEIPSLAKKLPSLQGSSSLGLKSLCLAVLGHPLEKSKKITMSNWATVRLSDKQVRYAALDAWVSYKIMDRLMHGSLVAQA